MIFADLTFRPHPLPPHWQIASGTTTSGLWFNVVEQAGRSSNFLRLRYRPAADGPVTHWAFDELVTRDEFRKWIADKMLGSWPKWAGPQPDNYAAPRAIGVAMPTADPPSKRQAFRHKRSNKTAWILERLKEGAPVQKVAEEAGVTRARVYQIIQRDKAERSVEA